MTTSPVDNTRHLEAEIAAEMRKVRGASMRRLLRLWLEYRGQVLAWIERYGLDEPSLTVDRIQDVLGCSRRTAYDYLAAVEVLYATENLRKTKMRSAYEQWAAGAKLRGQDASSAAWIESIRQAHRVTV